MERKEGGKMKNLITLIATLTVALLSGCCDMCDTEPPATPRGIVSVTGDENVTLYWCPNTETDFNGYFVYRSYCPQGPYNVIGNTRSAFFVDNSVTNGQTYYYAVSCYDYDASENR